MDSLAIYKWMAITTGVLFTLQWLFTVLGAGLFEDVGMETHHGAFSHGDIAHDGVSPFFSYLSIRNTINFLLAFSVTAYFLEKDYGLGFLAPIGGGLVGVAFVVLNVFVFSLFLKLQKDTSITRKDAIGQKGTVLIQVPAYRSGKGKATISVNGNLADYFVMTDGEAIPANQSVFVEEVLDSWVLLVRTTYFTNKEM